MKCIFPFLLLLATLGVSCSDDDVSGQVAAQVSLRFNHNWDGEEFQTSNFNTVGYANLNGEKMSVERLRYLISDVTFESSDGSSFTVEGYNLVDLTNETGLSYQLSDSVPVGNYTNVYFTFGFDNEDNQNGIYPDLNTALWNVPEMLGGGYHYMQLEGKFIDSTQTETGYQYHAIRAVDNSGEELVFEDTFFQVDLGPVEIQQNSTIAISMNIAEWFKNPNQWNLNQLHSMMMPNFEAQKAISQNGKTVFSLEGVFQE
ncbi:MbnP family protein [Pseudozobellia sp. WGM2]|uniref:MbnP family protein n=1 Tax=Pseudozobellia sp. WGM2 TaxID=2787625 RepID=UPI001AE07FC0|nr:MbnP family protein [Pseudozobellia sp. WGM2]